MMWDMVWFVFRPICTGALTSANSGRCSHNPLVSHKALGLANRGVFQERNPLGWREVAVLFIILVFLNSYTLYTRILGTVNEV
jgi:hypothetical protein